MIKAVIFDLDNTLYDYDAVNGKAAEYTGRWLCKETKISYEQFEKAFMQGRMLTKSHMRNCASQHNRMLYFQKTSEILGLNPIRYSLELYERYWGYMLHHMQLEEGADKLLKRLKNSGIRTGICTDLTAHIQHRKLRRLQIADVIDVFVSSEEADAEKPDRKIFDLVIAKSGVLPQEALYVGDSYEKDVAGAQNAGMYPVWFNPHGKQKSGRNIKNMLEIRKMEQLENYIYDKKF